MGWGDPDVYYQPEHFGLEIVFSEDHGGSYEFDMVVVWSDKDGNYYVGEDSGCSCPSPFEMYTSTDSLFKVETEHAVYQYLKDLSFEKGGDWMGLHTRFNRQDRQ